MDEQHMTLIPQLRRSWFDRPVLSRSHFDRLSANGRRAHHERRKLISVSLDLQIELADKIVHGGTADAEQLSRFGDFPVRMAECA